MAKAKKAVLLLSSGIDSPVAGHLLSKQGVELIGLHFVVRDGKASEKVVIELARKIGIKKVYIIPHYPVLKTLQASCIDRFRCLLCKRMMYRIADNVAEIEGCEFIATGDNLGQVASQTLANMTVLHSVLNRIMLSPLLCFDKNETISIARDIGTFELSSQIKKECSFIPNNPATKARKDMIENEEKKIDVEGMVTEILAKARTIDVELA